MIRGAGLLLLLAAAGCAEVRQRPPAPPMDLAAGAADPARQAIQGAAQAFADRGRGLSGQPAAGALAAAQLEFATDALARDPRFAPVPEAVRRQMELARTELRDALGVQEAAPPRPVIDGLLAAARALRANNQSAAARALPAPVFRPGGERSVARLGELGPLPQASNATALLAQQIAQLDAESGWNGTRQAETSGVNITTFGLGGQGGVGY
ncbi:hypothetical protein [Belnapia rosea]|uniref:Uncharacterized protein n=1 Tax=Belnapia rosea TaxID=938405 RepID=A0A1G6M453_9PROT|nr:hypothetical protein [Belnapia rosea]SDB44652.1 hypothetical protein SAMN02927895_01608 [Belnapia rosea]SDC50094.1 hypothetical protein SAMN04487779_10011091 [Belnapia rosea]